MLISVDTLRADRLGCYGATAVETPAIDSLARQGALRKRVHPGAAHPAGPLDPAHRARAVAPRRGRQRHVAGRPARRHPGRTFSAAGYDTAAFVAAFVLHRSFGLDRGFARYDDGPAADAALDQLQHATASADERVGRALRWLQQRRAASPRPAPFFLWLHLFDPHAPYAPPSDFRARYQGRPYDGEVAFVDSQVARLLAGLERLGAAEQTLVVLTADHGESLGEHGEMTHGTLLYDATLRVPLIVRLPRGERAGELRSDAAKLADVAPTLLALAGLAAGKGTEGRDLFAAKGGEPRQLGAISEAPRRRFGWAPLVALREAGWKYIAAPRPELYHLGDDPGERRDRLPDERRRAAELARGAREIEASCASAKWPAPPGRTPSRAPKPGPRSPPSATSAAPRAAARRRRPTPKTKSPSSASSTAPTRISPKASSSAPKPASGAARTRRFPRRARPRRGRPRRPPARPERRSRSGLPAPARRRSRQSDRPGAAGPARPRARRYRGRGKARPPAHHPRPPRRSRQPPARRSPRRAGDPTAAENEWQRGLAAAPTAGWLRLGYARFLKAAHREAEARAELDRLLADADLPEDLRQAAEGLR